MPGMSYDLPDAQWRKPSKCDNSGPNCVEVLLVDGHASVRNSQRPETVAGFDRDEWALFIDAVKAGEYDI